MCLHAKDLRKNDPEAWGASRIVNNALAAFSYLGFCVGFYVLSFGHGWKWITIGAVCVLSIPASYLNGRWQGENAETEAEQLAKKTKGLNPRG